MLLRNGFYVKTTLPLLGARTDQATQIVDGVEVWAKLAQARKH